MNEYSLAKVQLIYFHVLKISRYETNIISGLW